MSRVVNPPKILFVHGLEGSPNGTKVRVLKVQGVDVMAPDMEMSLLRLAKFNSVARNVTRLGEARACVGVGVASLVMLMVGSLWWGVVLLLALGWGGLRHKSWVSQAVIKSFEACVERQAVALKEHPVDLLVGSSWGGAVCLELVRQGKWQGPVLLLAPAYRRVGEWSKWRDIGKREARIGKQVRSCGMKVVIYHDRFDETVPCSDSIAFAARVPEVELHQVEAGGHRLLDLVHDGQLAETIQRLTTSVLRG